MSNPNNFIHNTDYATLKNVTPAKSGTVVIPGGVVVAGNGYVEFHTDVALGSPGAVSRSRIRSNKEASKWRTGGSTDSLRFGVVSGSGAIYDVYAFVWQPTPGVIRFSALIQNPYSATLTGVAGDEVIDFYTNTFLPPFA